MYVNSNNQHGVGNIKIQIQVQYNKCQKSFVKELKLTACQ
jgi:hypothetical protein